MPLDLHRDGQRGASLPELLVTLVLLAMIVLIPAIGFRRVSPPLDRATESCQAFFQQVRTTALANTRAYRISPLDAQTLRVQSANNCAASTWTDEPTLSLDLPSEVRFTSIGWQSCFSSRGHADAVATFELKDYGSGGGYTTQDLQLLLGGAVRIVP